jgi:outer membrane protein assembly factor BamB
VTRGTTICCSALALIALARKPEPMALVPIRTVWTLALNNQLTTAPAYDDRRAYFAIEHDRLVAYEIQSGAQVWLVEARSSFQPAAGEDLLFVPEPDAIVARHAADGTVAWRAPIAEPLAVRPVWDNGWLIAGTKSGAVLALRGSNGELLWQAALGSPAHAAPALAADRVYIPTADGRIVALNVETGATLWERRVGGMPNDILAQEDRLFFGSTDTYLYCVMAKDGRIDWRWRTGGDVIGRPLADDRHVYFVSLDNVLRSLDRKSGGQRWMRGLPLRPTTGPEKAGTTLVVAGVTPTLRTYNIADGAPATDLPAGGDIAAPPHVLAQEGSGLPMLLVVTRDIAKGATATLSVRSIDPAPAPVGPLPNAVMPAQTPPVLP